MMRQILLYLFILFACSVSAEPFKVTGKVVCASEWCYGEPLIGATVQVVGSHRGVATDGDGNFSIEVEKGAILKFSYLGYYEKVVEVLSDSSLVIELKEWKEFCFCNEYGTHIILPENHLKSSLHLIQFMYPDLKIEKDGNSMIVYKSANEEFSLYNDIVYKQYYSYKYRSAHRGINSKKAFESVYHDIMSSFKGYESSVESRSGKEVTFYYPEYSVKVQYKPQKYVSVTYELFPQYYK